MQKLLTLMIACVLSTALFANKAPATWNVVGQADFISGNIGSFSLAVDAGGTPYVAYTDLNQNKQLTVMKYDSHQWVSVGNVGAQGVTNPNIGIDSQGTPYVVFYSDNNGLILMKYDATTQWSSVGDIRSVTKNASNSQLSLGLNPSLIFEMNQGIYSMNYLRGQWRSPVGIPLAHSHVDEVQLTSYQNLLYVGYRDLDENNQLNVRMSPSWCELVPEGLSSQVSDTNLTVDTEGNPYVAYQDNTSANQVRIISAKTAGVSNPCQDSRWSFVGNTDKAPISLGDASSLRVVVDSNKTPYLAYELSAKEINVKKFDGTQWVDYDSPIARDAIVDNLSFSASTHQLYLAYLHCPANRSHCAINVMSHSLN